MNHESRLFGQQAQRVPLTVNLKDNATALIIFWIVVFSLAAVFFKWWMTALADRTQDNKPTFSRFLKWFHQQWVTVSMALIGAAGSVFIAKYYNLVSFTPSNRIPLFFATFTAVTTASLLTTTIGAVVVTPNANQPVHPEQPPQ